MPELPDLQVFSGNLNKRLSGKKVKQVIVSSSKIKKPEKDHISRTLAGQKIKKVYREGKELRFLFENKAVLGMHLMLHGRLEIPEKEQHPKHAMIELRFEDGSGLVLTDFQGIARPTLNPVESKTPDAASPELTAAYLKDRLSGSRATIKNFLLDQKMIRGIGNAYADEILWAARISPFSISSRIPEPAIKKLAASIHTVLSDAEAQIRKENKDIISGEIRDFLKIHQAAKKETETGFPIQKATTGGRKTYFTEEQKLYQ